VAANHLTPERIRWYGVIKGNDLDKKRTEQRAEVLVKQWYSGMQAGKTEYNYNNYY
jgi:hypothetical protein